MSKYGVFSGPYFRVFRRSTRKREYRNPNKGTYGPEKNPYLDTFHAVVDIDIIFLK